jgi:hypothetical protein
MNISLDFRLLQKEEKSITTKQEQKKNGTYRFVVTP